MRIQEDLQRFLNRDTHSGYRPVLGSNEICNFMPIAWASRSSVRVDGLTRPLFGF